MLRYVCSVGIVSLALVSCSTSNTILPENSANPSQPSTATTSSKTYDNPDFSFQYPVGSVLTTGYGVQDGSRTDNVNVNGAIAVNVNNDASSSLDQFVKTYTADKTHTTIEKITFKDRPAYTYVRTYAGKTGTVIILEASSHNKVIILENSASPATDMVLATLTIK